jgi:hypothetical protein
MALEDRYFEIYRRCWGEPKDSLSETNRGLRERLEALTRAAHCLGHDPIPAMYVGEAPTNQVQAEVFAVEGGYLILLHEALLLFAFQAIGLISAVLNLTFKGKIEPPSMPFDEAKVLFNNLITYFTSGGDLKLVWPVTSYRESFAFGLCERFVDFVIAHEVAHVLCGHFTAPTGSINQKRIKPLRFDKLSIENEFEADVTAVRLVKQLNKEFRAPLSEVSLYLAPILFFELRFALRQRGNRHRITTHPHPTVRQSYIIASTAEDPSGKFFNLESAVTTIRKLNGEEYESGAYRDKANRLLAHATKCVPPSELDELFRGETKKGMKEFRPRDLLHFIEQNEEKARSAIALTAVLYLLSDLESRGVGRNYLGILIALYLDFYDKQVCQAFIMILRECFPDYPAIIEEARHMLIDQNL